MSPIFEFCPYWRLTARDLTMRIDSRDATQISMSVLRQPNAWRTALHLLEL